MSDILPGVPRWPNAIGDGRPSEPVTVPWRPGTSTVSYGGPRPYEIAERVPRARAQHVTAIAAARAARIAGDHGAHVRALRAAGMARWHLAQMMACKRALDVIWFDRTWFYFDDAEYARRCALMPERPVPHYRPARSRGEDESYIRRRRIARRAIQHP